LVALSRGSKVWARLPGTRLEARTLGALVPDNNTLLGSEASEQKFVELAATKQLRRYRLLHLATHGDVNPECPRETALILAQDKLPTADEAAKLVLAGKKPLTGRLTVDRILTEWNLDADLVVLSACQTGLGKQTSGEGMLGFTQALLKAGARSVVLSRWKVDDHATALLMQRFYQNLLGARPGLEQPLGKAAALAEAKRWLRTLDDEEAVRLLSQLPRGARGEEPVQGKGPIQLGRPYEHPYYWAGFILIGDPGDVSQAMPVLGDMPPTATAGPAVAGGVGRWWWLAAGVGVSVGGLWLARRFHRSARSRASSRS
jgi:CHAT domain-containing protein